MSDEKNKIKSLSLKRNCKKITFKWRFSRLPADAKRVCLLCALAVVKTSSSSRLRAASLFDLSTSLSLYKW